MATRTAPAAVLPTCRLYVHWRNNSDAAVQPTQEVRPRSSGSVHIAIVCYQYIVSTVSLLGSRTPRFGASFCIHMHVSLCDESFDMYYLVALLVVYYNLIHWHQCCFCYSLLIVSTLSTTRTEAILNSTKSPHCSLCCECYYLVFIHVHVYSMGSIVHSLLPVGKEKKASFALFRRKRGIIWGNGEHCEKQIMREKKALLGNGYSRPVFHVLCVFNLALTLQHPKLK